MDNKYVFGQGSLVNKAARILGSYKEGDVIKKSLENDIEKSEGSRGGKVIGHTKSGKPVYANSKHPSHKDFSEEDHENARHIHMNEEHTGRNMQERDEAAADHGREADKLKGRYKGDKGQKEDTKEAHEKRGFDESKGDEDVTGKSEKIKKSSDIEKGGIGSGRKLVVGKKYTTSSGMGGSFTVKYHGKKEDGKHSFENVTNKDFKGSKYSVEDKDVDEWVTGEHVEKSDEDELNKAFETLGLTEESKKKI